jgi:hypothetical protein
MKMMVLRFYMFLLESRALKAVIEQCGLLVCNDALPTGEFSLLVQKSTQFPSDFRIRRGCIECKAGHTYRIDACGGRTDTLLEIYCRSGRIDVSVAEFCSVVPICHPLIRDCGNQSNLESSVAHHLDRAPATTDMARVRSQRPTGIGQIQLA